MARAPACRWQSFSTAIMALRARRVRDRSVQLRTIQETPRQYPLSFDRDMTTLLYGIPNCDTVKKARNWLAEHAQPFDFHDFKKQGLDRAQVALWLEQLDWTVLVNRKGTTWRALSDERKAAVVGADSALELMLAFPSVVKRPVLHEANTVSVGFSDAKYRQIFNLPAPT